jgi:tetratricopeptide (TPR) repeat protein
MNKNLSLKAKRGVIAFLGANRLKEAKKACDKLCRACRHDPECWSLAGAVEERLGRPKRAVDAYKAAISLRPNYYEALYNVGCILLNAGEGAEAFAFFERALAARPDSPEVLNNLGVLLKNRGDIEAAAQHFKRAGVLQPGNQLAWFNLGNTLSLMGNAEEAVASYQKAVSIDPGYTEAYFGMGNALRQLFLRAEAVDCFQRVVGDEPGHRNARLALAEVLVLLGRHNEAIGHLDAILRSDPSDVEVLAAKAETLEKKGDLQLAYELIQLCLSVRPVNARVALTFANLCRHFEVCDAAVACLDQLLAAGDMSIADAASLHQAKGKILDREKDYKKAFHHFNAANRLKQSLGGRSRHNEDIDASLAFFSPGVLASRPHSSVTSELPVFIVGMPRSGTSLVEQIIASHPEAHGAGELPYINRFVSRLPALTGAEAGYPECLSNITPAMLDSLARQYLGYLRSLDSQAQRITDKLPHNFMWLGMIELLFPRARIIHCVREPMDNCLSLYTTRGFNAHHSYAFDLETLGRHFQKYQQLMSLWRRELQLPMLELKYENLVWDFETEVRRLIDFCGLAWDDRCLRYHENGRVSTTLSYDQVRSPIYKGSVGRWRNYKSNLSRLEEILGYSG